MTEHEPVPLTRPLYGRAFEPLCAVGQLTEQLARRCIQVTATDFRPEVVESARVRCSRFEHVDIRQAELLADPPAGRFDLIVLRDLTQYGAPDDVLHWLAALAGRLQFGGELVLIHRLRPHPGDFFTTDTLRRLLSSDGACIWICAVRWGESRVDTWRRL